MVKKTCKYDEDQSSIEEQDNTSQGISGEEEHEDDEVSSLLTTTDSFIVEDDDDDDDEDDSEENREDDSDSFYSDDDSEYEEGHDSNSEKDSVPSELLYRKIEELKKSKKCSSEFIDFITTLSQMKTPNIISIYEKYPPEVQRELNATLKTIQEEDNYEPIIFQILLSQFPISIKMEALRRSNSSKRDAKTHAWVEHLLKIPINQYATPFPEDLSTRKQVERAQRILDEAVYGHEKAKHQIIQYICQLKRNPSAKGLVLGIKGPMGNGKTTLIEKGVSKILNRPFSLISLGGAIDSCFLNGHSFTYEGSTWGQIIDVLMKTHVMNPIIYFDELDKISETPKGDEITNLLIHMIDPSQNQHFQDRYFGNVDFDISKVTFVFSYNDSRKINPILLDRILEIETEGLMVSEKMIIASQYMIPRILEDIGLPMNDNLVLSTSFLQKIIDMYTLEAGVRQLQKILYHIYREVNVKLMTSKHRRSSLVFHHMSFQTFQEKFLHNFFTEIERDMVKEEGRIGRINGLYANALGVGGILPIETSLIIGHQLFGVEITGNLGKVMHESVHVAKSVAWNQLPVEKQEEWRNQWKSNPSHIHIHCEEMAIEKEGPSATLALSLAIYSLFIHQSISPHVALTGEMNLAGEIKRIGGLREKIQGAYYANVTTLLYPMENKKEVQQLLKKSEFSVFLDKMHIIPISNITDTFPYVFVVKTDSKKRNRVLSFT